MSNIHDPPVFHKSLFQDSHFTSVTNIPSPKIPFILINSTCAATLEAQESPLDDSDQPTPFLPDHVAHRAILAKMLSDFRVNPYYSSFTIIYVTTSVSPDNLETLYYSLWDKQEKLNAIDTQESIKSTIDDISSRVVQLHIIDGFSDSRGWNRMYEAEHPIDSKSKDIPPSTSWFHFNSQVRCEYLETTSYSLSGQKNSLDAQIKAIIKSYAVDQSCFFVIVFDTLSLFLRYNMPNNLRDFFNSISSIKLKEKASSLGVINMHDKNVNKTLSVSAVRGIVALYSAWHACNCSTMYHSVYSYTTTYVHLEPCAWTEDMKQHDKEMTTLGHALLYVTRRKNSGRVAKTAHFVQFGLAQNQILHRLFYTFTILKEIPFKQYDLIKVSDVENGHEAKHVDDHKLMMQSAKNQLDSLPFKLELTEKEKKSRAKVVLPYEHQNPDLADSCLDVKPQNWSHRLQKNKTHDSGWFPEQSYLFGSDPEQDSEDDVDV